MTLTRLRQMLDAYGADSRLWPEEERDAALALLAASAAARAMLDEAARFDRLLDLAPRAHPSSDLAADILAMAAPSRWRRLAAALWPFGPAWQPAAALVSALVIGVAVGPLLPDSLMNGTTDDVTLALDEGVYAAPLAIGEEDAL